MSVTVEAHRLATALNAVAPAASTAVLPAAGMARLVIGQNRCFVQAKGTEVQATANFEAELGLDPGWEVYVPARRLASMMGVLGESKVELTSAEDIVEVHTPRSSMTLRGIIPEDDRVPLSEEKPQEADWWSRLYHLAYAASSDRSKPALCSVQLDDGWAYCTDSYRIAAQRTDYDGPPMLLPAELIRECEQVCGSVEKISQDNGAVYAFGHAGWVRGSLIEADPLPWRQLTPLDKAEMRGSFVCADMAEALRVCGTAVEDRSHGRARVSLKALDGAIDLSVGSSADDLSVVTGIDAKAPLFKTSVFNPLFLSAAIDQMSSHADEIYLHQIDRSRFSFTIFTGTEVAAEAREFAVVVPYSS
jgi:hypothetical protein